MGKTPILHLMEMGVLTALRMAVQHSATVAGCSIRHAPKRPAPATLSLGHPQLRLISSYLQRSKRQTSAWPASCNF